MFEVYMRMRTKKSCWSRVPDPALRVRACALVVLLSDHGICHRSLPPTYGCMYGHVPLPLSSNKIRSVRFGSVPCAYLYLHTAPLPGQLPGQESVYAQRSALLPCPGIVHRGCVRSSGQVWASMLDVCRMYAGCMLDVCWMYAVCASRTLPGAAPSHGSSLIRPNGTCGEPAIGFLASSCVALHQYLMCCARWVRTLV